MTIIIGHTNSDLDCLGSMVLARYLYPDAEIIQSRHIHPTARNLYNLYRDHFNMKKIKEVKNTKIEKIVIVDTRTKERIKEFSELFKNFDGEIEIWDHHPADTSNIENAKINFGDYGANTTLIGNELLNKKTKINKDDATIALAGIFADTGNFTYDKVTDIDFKVASWLIESDASLTMVRKFLTRLSDLHQKNLFHELINNLTYQNFHGHFIVVSYKELEQQQGGLAAIVEEIHNIENPDATFCIFYFKKEQNTIIISRSQKKTIAVNSIMENFGGGGHQMAASAYLKNKRGETVLVDLLNYLKQQIIPAFCAKDIMSYPVKCINPNWTLKKASIFLEEIDHTGAPVLNEKEELLGILSLRDIMKGRKVNQINSPVHAYMSKKIITISTKTTIREIEDLIFKNNIGHLPVLNNYKIVGLITRTDLLNILYKQQTDTKILPNDFNIKN